MRRNKFSHSQAMQRMQQNKAKAKSQSQVGQYSFTRGDRTAILLQLHADESRAL